MCRIRLFLARAPYVCPPWNIFRVLAILRNHFLVAGKRRVFLLTEMPTMDTPDQATLAQRVVELPRYNAPAAQQEEIPGLVGRILHINPPCSPVRRLIGSGHAAAVFRHRVG